VAYYYKFHHQKKKSCILSAGMFVFVDINHWHHMSIFRRQQRFYPLFLLAAAKSALIICRVLLTILAQRLKDKQHHEPVPGMPFIDVKSHLFNGFCPEKRHTDRTDCCTCTAKLLGKNQATKVWVKNDQYRKIPRADRRIY